MRLDVSQQLRLQQQMRLSPRMIQAMEILQLPMLALQERIEAELESNPVLEMQHPEVDEEAPPAREDPGEDRGERALVVEDGNHQSEDFNRLEDFTREYGTEFINSESRRPRADHGDRDPKMEAMANAPAHAESLDEYLLEQWRFVEVNPKLKAAGELIIANIDDDGYLRTSLEDLFAQTDGAYRPEERLGALHLVQSLDPLGVGARDLQECMTIQLEAEANAGRDVSLELLLVERHLRDIEMNHLPRIAQRTERTIDQVKEAIENLSRLTPHPGRLIVSRTVPVINPDVIVDIDEDGQIVAMMADGSTPGLRISRMYRRLARDRGTDGEARKFLQQNIRSAQWLVSAIRQRRETVRRVAEEVFRAQRGFLDDGEEALKPLPMADIAEKVGVHVATISRAVAGKYAQTPRGIYPLRMFFSGGTKTSGGDSVSWDAVKVKLKEIVDAEDKSKPLNDDQLAAALSDGGVKIARRTVAKYRNLMDIPPARKRRTY
jgi:RNA polymerase sigma-54 factor